jgi:capsular exopolysaccharide synthesis family protein
MEPLDYLKILQRHWKIVAALIAVVVLAAYFLAPGKPAQEYEARHTLLRETSSGDLSGADNPGVVELWATRGTVPQRVAERVGHQGSPDALTNRLTTLPNIELGTVELTATAGSPDEAILLVNAFAEETLRYIDELNRAEADEVAAELSQLRTQLREADAQIQAAGGENAPGAATAKSERDRLTSEMQLITSQSTTTEWVSLQIAATAKEAEGSGVGVSRSTFMALGIVCSVLLAFGVAIMLDRSDSRLHTKEQAERQFGLPVLAEVPLLSLRSRHRAAVYGYEHDTRVAEAYRALRTALLLFRDRLPLEVEAAELSGRAQARAGRGASPRQVVLVTSAEAGDGKSTTAANLAMAYAESGQSVLLVQWDLWRPLPARVFDAQDEPGVREFLEDSNQSLMHYVQPTSVPGLHLVPAGKLGSQPGGQLDAELRLLEQARRMADVVIIDTAPLLAASVTRELVTMADVVVVTSRVGRTTSPNAERASELLERLGAPTLGVVLVGVPTGLFKDYYAAPSRTERLKSSIRRGDSRTRSSAQHSQGHGSSNGGDGADDGLLPSASPPMSGPREHR